MIVTVADAILTLYGTFSEKVTADLKNLFQTKHLYQSVRIDLNNFTNIVLGDDTGKGFTQAAVEGVLTSYLGQPWVPKGAIAPAPALSNNLWFVTPDVKLYCKICKRTEAFNPIFTEDFLMYGGRTKEGFQTKHGLIQVFVFSFLCQACKTVPEVFIVRREDLKLTLCGRAPIEHTEVPSTIPKNIKHFYSGAIVAYQSGQALAGIFLLRTLIEQWAKSKTERKDLQADQAIDSYLDTLPTDFKERFPSLRVLYGELSFDIHSAKGSPELFEKARNQIDEHFDARRLFKLI